MSGMVEPCLATLVSLIVLSNNDILLINKSTINGLNFCVTRSRSGWMLWEVTFFNVSFNSLAGPLPPEVPRMQKVE
ncbi:hypothetical protein OsI_05233 [Oryza sativa Indica Group]|nr:hypothetical protein OsI_05233 [Oryza sativa Indica Group]